MASTVTTTNELNIELLSDDGTASRILKISDPKNGLYREDIVEALAPLFPHETSDSDSAIVPLFYDDNTPAGLTKIGTIERVYIQKTVTPIE